MFVIKGLDVLPLIVEQFTSNTIGDELCYFVFDFFCKMIDFRLVDYKENKKKKNRIRSR